MAGDKGRSKKRGAQAAPLNDSELRKHGVQVKSGPEEVSAERLESAPTGSESVDLDFSLDEIAAAGPQSHQPPSAGLVEDEFSIPDYSFSGEEGAEALPLDLSEDRPDMDGSMDIGVMDEAVPEADAMDGGGLPALDLPPDGPGPSIDEFADLAEVSEDEQGRAPSASRSQEFESLEDLPEASDGPEPGVSTDSEELSLDDFGLSFDAEPPKEARKRSDDSSSQAGATDEVSLDDFLDGESFEPPPEAAEMMDETPLPIDMDLDFDETLDEKPLSLEIDETAGEEAEAHLDEEEVDRIVAAPIDTEEVRDFDDFLSSDALPQAIRPTSLTQEMSTVSSGSFVSSAAVDDISIQDQTSLVGEASGVALGMDAGIEHAETSSIQHGTAIYGEDTDAVLANIEDISRPFGEAEVARPPANFRRGKTTSEAEEIDEFASVDTLSGEEPFEDSFDDLAALEESLSEEEDSDVSASRGASDPILQRIADELSSIKRELSTLKEEISSIRSGARPEAGEQEEDRKAGGFFDEEEDETISLTGDELDNILNTADFTEEMAASDSHGNQASELPDLIPLDGAPAIEEIALDGEAPLKAGASPQGFSDDDKGLSDLKRIEADGLRVMTEAPEDTSYLEEPISEELEEMSIPDIALEEPDLSDFAVEELDEGFSGGSALDDLPVIDAGDAEGLEEEFSDITLDIDAPPVLAEAPSDEFGAPSIPEDEGPESEISLADETAPIRRSDPVQVHPDDLSMELDEDLFVPAAEPEKRAAQSAPPASPKPSLERRAEASRAGAEPSIPDSLKKDIKSVLTYMDRLLESLPEDKIEEFARSEHFTVYKKLFEELGLV